jgi:hypothetical protein
MSFNRHDLGDLVRVSTGEAGFTVAVTGDTLDPDAVFLSVRSPSGLMSYEYGVGDVIVKDGVGKYHADIDADEPGVWFYRWWSTGNGQAANEGRFEVKEAHAV